MPIDQPTSAIPPEILQEAQGYHLALHLHPGGYYVAVFDPGEGTFPWIGEATADVIHPEPFRDVCDLLKSQPWSRQVFRVMTLTFDTPDFTLVPTGLVREGHEGDLLTFHRSSSPDPVRTMALHELAATVVYRVPGAIIELSRHLQGARILPSSSLALRYAMSHHDRQTDEFHLVVQPGYLLLTAILKGEHKMTNHFPAQTEEDILYYLSHAAIRLGADLEHARIRLYGQGITRSLTALLATYSRHIELWTAPAGIHTPETIEAVRHFSTLIHPICAL
ncbi:MAG: DUF3822 family protein [Flavobacteriales bacterium]|jgi:hypothetical protein